MGCSSSSSHYVAGNGKGPKLTFSAIASTSVLEILAPPRPIGGVSSRTDAEGDEVPNMAMKAVETYGDPFDNAKLGIGYSCVKGSKKMPNQDSFLLLRSSDNLFSIYAVMDGHGKLGHDISNFVKDNLVKMMFMDPRFLTAERPAAMRDAFLGMQKWIDFATKQKTLPGDLSGTTCVFVFHDHREDKLTVAHVGDSGCYIGVESPKSSTAAGSAEKETTASPPGVPDVASAEEPGSRGDAKPGVWSSEPDRIGEQGSLVTTKLTRDHKPTIPEEKARIVKCGGVVAFDGHKNYRVFVKGKQYPGLNMSRTLGQVIGHKEAGMSSEPDIAERKLEPEDKVLLLCSDGVSEFYNAQDAVDAAFGYKSTEAMDAAADIVKVAWGAWEKAKVGYVDDITALIIYLNRTAPAGRRSKTETQEVQEV